MQVTVPAEALRRSLKLCGDFVPETTPKESLKYVRVQISGDRLELTGGNGETLITNRIVALTPSVRSGVYMLPAARASQLVDLWTSESLTLADKGDGAIILSETDREFRLLTIPNSEYPPIVAPDTSPAAVITVAAKTLATAIELTRWAVGKEEKGDAALQDIHSRIRFEVVKSVLTVVGTNGRRLSIVECNCSGDDAEFCLYPKDARRIQTALSTVADSADVVLSVYSSITTVAFGMSLITIRQLDVRFPKWRKVAASFSGVTLSTPAKPLLSGIKQAMLGRAHEDDDVSIRLRFTADTLIFEGGREKKPTAKKGLFETESKTAMLISYDGPGVMLRVDPNDLSAWLGKLDGAESVEWTIKNEASPFLLTAGSARFVMGTMGVIE